MDERTRASDTQTSAEFRRATPPPAPAVEKRRAGSGIAVGLVLLIVTLLGCYLIVRLSVPRPADNAARDSQAASQPVGAATIGRGNVRVTVSALGTVTPIATVTVQTQINGQLQEVAFTQGQMVKKGDFLAQVDPRPYQLLQAQYEAQLAHDQGVLEQARTDLARYQKLAEQNSIARQQYEDQVYVVQQDEGTVKVDQSLINQQKLNVTYCHILSPITGRIGLRLVDPGNYVQTNNNTGLAVITQVQPITVIFPLPEDELPNVLPQLTAGTPLEVQAYDRANVRLLATGRVAALDSQIDTTTGMVKLRAQFDNADNALFPNQFVNARLLVETLHDVVTVPNAAIQRGSPGT
jgi:multidrug efflux system membrane fusion protein